MSSLLVLVLLAVPGVGLAVEPSALEEKPAQRQEVPESLHLTEPALQPEGRNPAPRIMAELGFVAVGAATVGLTGMLFGGFVDSGNSNCGATYGPCVPDGAVYGLIAGASLGAPIGAWTGGKIAGGRGTFEGTLLGTGVAAAAGGLTSLLVTNDDIKPFCIPVFSMVGAIVSYEISHSVNSAPPPAGSASVVPVVSVTGTYAALGLSGSF